MENKYVELTDITTGEQIDNLILADGLPHQGVAHIFKEMGFLAWVWVVYVPSFGEGFILTDFPGQLYPFSLS